MPTIHEVGAVFVAVSDQEQALAFYVDTLGFEKRVDFVYGGSLRWLEVAPKGAKNTIALVPPREGPRVASDHAICAFATDDLEGQHAALKKKGVTIDAEIAGKGSSRQGLIGLKARVENPVPAQFFFRDPDGNRFLMVPTG